MAVAVKDGYFSELENKKHSNMQTVKNTLLTSCHKGVGKWRFAGNATIPCGSIYTKKKQSFAHMFKANSSFLLPFPVLCFLLEYPNL